MKIYKPSPESKSVSRYQKREVQEALSELRTEIVNKARSKYEMTSEEVSILISHCDLVEIYYTVPSGWLEDRVMRYLNTLPDKQR